jgi:hypothetical protein
MSASGSSFAPARGAQHALMLDGLVEHDGDNDHRAGNKSAPGRIDAEEYDAARDHLDDQHPDHGAEHGA